MFNFETARTQNRIKNFMVFIQSPSTAIVDMSEGNPGAINVMMMAIQHGGAIDTHSVWGAYGSLLSLDNYQIYGPRIWILYKYICGQDIVKFIGILRAMNMGILPDKMVKQALDDHMERQTTDVQLDLKGALEKVRALLSDFPKDWQDFQSRG